MCLNLNFPIICVTKWLTGSNTPSCGAHEGNVSSWSHSHCFSSSFPVFYLLLHSMTMMKEPKKFGWAHDNKSALSLVSINLHTACATLSMIISQFLRHDKFSVVYKYSDFSASRCFSESPLRQWDKPPQYCFQGLVSFARWLCRVLQTKSLKRLISFKFHPRQISQQSKPHTRTTAHRPPFNLRRLIAEERTLAESLESVLLSC